MWLPPPKTAKVRRRMQALLSDFREPMVARLMVNICAHIRKGSARDEIIKSLTEEGFSREDCQKVIEKLTKRYVFNDRDYTGRETYYPEWRPPVL